MNIFHDLYKLYRRTFLATIQSFRRCWMIAIVVAIYVIGWQVIMGLVRPLGMLGGLILGIVNAFIIGSLLALVEQSIHGARRISLSDIQGSIGQYFWDVIGLLFLLMVPVWLLEQGMQGNPNGRFITMAIFLLGFILLNPALEIIYQVRGNSPLEIIKESYEFVLENWIEWFVPIALILAPLGFQIFFVLSSRIGRGAGLHFMELMFIPITVLNSWLQYFGVSEGVSMVFLIVFVPPFAILMLMFRGHLFSALHGTTRRSRLFREKSSE